MWAMRQEGPRQFALKLHQSMGNAQRLRSNHTYCDLTRHCRSFLAADLSLGILLPSDQSILDSSTKRILRSQEQALLSPKLQTFIWLVGAPRKVQTPSRGSSQALLPSPCHRPIHPFHSHALSPLQEFSCAIPSPLSKELTLGPSGLSFCLFFWTPFFIKSEFAPGSSL